MTAFRKQLTCPTAETLLTYRAGFLPPPAGEEVTRHLSECEFCGAELQLLVRCPLSEEDGGRPAEVPPHLKTLFEESVSEELGAMNYH